MQHGAAVELLARVPVFHGLGGELLGVILQTGTIAHLRAGQTIVQAGVSAEAALFVMEGSIRLQDANGLDLEPVVGPGTVLCDMAMLIETSHIHSAVADSDVTIIGLSREAMGRQMAAEPRLATHLAGNIRRNLAATAETLHQLDRILAEPVAAGPDLDDPALLDETIPPAAGLPIAPDLPAPETSGVANGFANGVANGAANGVAHSAANGVANGLENGAANGGANGFGPRVTDSPAPDFLRQPAPVASHFNTLIDRSVNEARSRVPVHDLLAGLNGANGDADRNRSGPERDRTAVPSPAPHRQRAATPRPVSGRASPIHGQAAGRG